MKYIKSILALSLLLVLYTSCENDGFYYQDDARIRLVGPEIWTVGTDSLEYTFATAPADMEVMNMEVEATVMGPVANYDRTTRIAVDTKLTTASSDLYNVPETVTIPAGKGRGVFNVTLKRGETLNSTTVRLYIKVEASDDFGVGTNEENHLLLKWSNIISKPSNWDEELAEHFGAYSETKYRFMLSHSNGVSEFSSNMSWAELHNYNIKFTNALNEYNAANPGKPLAENGVLITFPQK